MKCILVLSIAAVCAYAAPTDENLKFKADKDKKWEPTVNHLEKSAYGAQSSYGGSSGLSGFVPSSFSAPISSAPCGSSGPLPLALYLSPQIPSASFSAVPQSGTHYREDEHEHSEEHKARSYYESSSLSGFNGLSAPAAAMPSSAISFTPETSAAPAVGVFPNARVGGCAVPILLSCSPNVVSGQLAQPAHASSYSVPSSFSAPSYRMHEHEHELKREMRNTADWKATGKSASHFQVSKDFPEDHQGNHHVISKDYPEPNLVKISTAAPALN